LHKCSVNRLVSKPTVNSLTPQLTQCCVARSTVS